MVIGVVRYSSTALERSSRLNIRETFRSVSKKTSAAPYQLSNTPLPIHGRLLEFTGQSHRVSEALMFGRAPAGTASGSKEKTKEQVGTLLD